MSLAVVLAALMISVGCAWASARRLTFAVAPTALSTSMLVDAVKRAGPGARSLVGALSRALEGVPGADWERDLLAALTRPEAERAVLINEQLAEMDWRLTRWARVPRVCASIAASAGFLLATLMLRESLSDPAAFDPEARTAVIGAALHGAVSVAAIGMAGTAFCLAAHRHARLAARAHQEAVDALVERLEAVSLP